MKKPYITAREMIKEGMEEYYEGVQKKLDGEKWRKIEDEALNELDEERMERKAKIHNKKVEFLQNYFSENGRYEECNSINCSGHCFLYREEVDYECGVVGLALKGHPDYNNLRIERIPRFRMIGDGVKIPIEESNKNLGSRLE